MTDWAIRIGLGAAATSVVAFFMLVGVDLGGTITGGNFVFFVIWCAPIVLYVVGVRSRLVSLIGGTALVVALLVLLLLLFRDTSSTAGIGVFALPLAIATATGLVVGAEALWRDGQRSQNHQR